MLPFRKPGPAAVGKAAAPDDPVVVGVTARASRDKHRVPSLVEESGVARARRAERWIQMDLPPASQVESPGRRPRAGAEGISSCTTEGERNARF